ncbi:MAG TPA: hypothetical protein VK190_02625 [Pseudoneobacillus sp.]|nr:hypothetical protein [Pseudoneobacillus sp.]
MRFAEAYLKVRIEKELEDKRIRLLEFFDDIKVQRMKRFSDTDMHHSVDSYIRQLKVFSDLTEKVETGGLAEVDLKLFSDAIFYLSPDETTRLEKILDIDITMLYNVELKQNIENKSNNDYNQPF